ncbi:MAG TPA: hypothetical protein VL326_19465 [Kofleriaceae bacterium]|nr:hypothetical protein [Kofleriaceae bacterium]
MATKPATETVTETETDDGPPAAPQIGFPKKTLYWIFGVSAVIWAFAITTGSKIFMGIVGALTVVLAFVLLRAFMFIRKQRGIVDVLQGAQQSPEARKDALAKLEQGKDANAPTTLFARAQLMAADDPKSALQLLDKTDLKAFPPGMQDDVSLLRTQLFLGLGRTADARKAADTINLDNPERKAARPLAASIVAEAWARTGKPKEALKLLESMDVPAKDAAQIAIQAKVASVFARFAANQRGLARNELNALADEDVNYLGRFLDPRFRVHPELQKLARQVLEKHPAARKVIKSQAQRRQ